MLCEPELGTRCLLVLMCGITAKALKIWVQVEQRPRAVDTSLVVSHWPSEKRSLEKLGKDCFEHGREKSNPLHCGAVPSSGLVAKGYGQSANANIKEQDLICGRDHCDRDSCCGAVVGWVDLQAQPAPPACPRDPSPCSAPWWALARASKSLPAPSPLPSSLPASSSSPALRGPLQLTTHPPRQAVWLHSACAFVCMSMCFFLL